MFCRESTLYWLKKMGRDNYAARMIEHLEGENRELRQEIRRLTDILVERPLPAPAQPEYPSEAPEPPPPAINDTVQKAIDERAGPDEPELKVWLERYAYANNHRNDEEVAEEILVGSPVDL